LSRLPLAAALAAAPALAAEPEALIFSAGTDSYAVPAEALASLEAGGEGGLTLCFSEAAEAEIAAFTERQQGGTVTVSIGERALFDLQVVEPYAGGCITWPLHPKLAETYRGWLTGEG
jgi:hypothetical protein